jgi:hypothetical protein
MRKLWFRRRGVETIIGGMIVLVLFLFALVAMVVLSQQYDLYQVSAATMQRRDTETFSENLEGVYPGIQPGDPPQLTNPSDCAGSECNVYFIILANLGIETQISRIYINSTESPGCTTPCVLDPSNTPAPDKFRASDAYINPGEMRHTILFWLPWDPSKETETLTHYCTVGGVTVNYNCHVVTLVTSRGRVFSFHYPFSPQSGSSAIGAGGTGIYIGPLVYTFQRPLITYTNATVLVPPIPIGGGTNGYWVLPPGNLIIYVKLQTDVGVQHDVYLTTKSVLELALYSSPGSVNSFYIVAPITHSFCETFHQKDSTINCDTSYGYSPDNCTPPSCIPGNTGDPSGSNLVLYKPCPASLVNYNTAYCTANYPVGARYMIPKPNADQQAAKSRGDPVIVAFAVNKACTSPTSCSGVSLQNLQNSWAGNSATSFLGLTYVWDDGPTPTGSGTGPYIYGVTLPFVAVCIQSYGTCR